MQSAEKPNLVKMDVDWFMHQLQQQLIGLTLVAYASLNIISVKEKQSGTNISVNKETKKSCEMYFLSRNVDGLAFK
jgi:hypothetical protein